jgi:hypothetical protein
MRQVGARNLRLKDHNRSCRKNDLHFSSAGLAIVGYSRTRHAATFFSSFRRRFSFKFKVRKRINAINTPAIVRRNPNSADRVRHGERMEIRQ